MFELVHNKLTRKYKAYRDWHRSENSSIANASLFVIFSLYLSAVVWLAAKPAVLKESRVLNVLGTSVGPSNLAHEMDRNEITVTPVETENQFSILVTTTKDSNVWIEYDNNADGTYSTMQSSEVSMTHLLNLWQYNVGEDYVYRIGATDMDGYTVYSQVYSFRK